MKTLKISLSLYLQMQISAGVRIGAPDGLGRWKALP